MTLNQEINKSYRIADYFLDGYYIKSEGIFQHQKPEISEIILFDLPGGQSDIQAEVTDVIDISEDEYRVILVRV